FVAVAQAGSLSAAARKLGQPVTTVSRQLAALEAALGASLVTRTTRSHALTDAGRRYLDVCRRVLEEIASVEGALRGGAAGELAGALTVTAPTLFGRLHVLPVIARFLAAHSKVDVRLMLTDRVVDLVEEGVDLAVRVGALPDSTLIATRAGGLRHVVCAAPSYLRRRGEPVEPRDLAGHDAIQFAGLDRAATWVFRSGAHGRVAVPVAARLVVDTADAAVDAAAAGLGITRVLSYQAADALRKKAVRAVLSDWDDTEVPVHVVTRPVRFPKPAARALAEAVVAGLRGG
ncbi:MAG: LysR family transcriptional regulator, partial [Hyphomicrobiaceae bacterium]|nr:LysR family transcriptional regulator [Hyphomicrobiaceae bacterium]